MITQAPEQKTVTITLAKALQVKNRAIGNINLAESEVKESWTIHEAVEVFNSTSRPDYESIMKDVELHRAKFKKLGMMKQALLSLKVKITEANRGIIEDIYYIAWRNSIHADIDACQARIDHHNHTHHITLTEEEYQLLTTL